MLSFMKERKYALIAILIFWIAVLFFLIPRLSHNRLELIERSYTGNRNGLTDEFLAGDVIEQHFTASRDKLTQISFFVATYGGNKYNNIEVILLDSDGNTLADDYLNACYMRDNAWVCWDIETQSESKGKTYTILIKSVDGAENATISFYTSHVSLEHFNHSYNGETSDSMITMKEAYESTALNSLRTACWISLILITLIGALLIGKADEKTYLKLALLFAPLFIFIVPFFHPIDESTHFFRSLLISQGDLIDTIEDGYIGGYVPENYDFSEYSLSIKEYYQNSEIWAKPLSGTKSFYYNPYMSSYLPVCHLIGAAGLLVGRILHLPSILVILLGRISNYAFYTWLCFLAIKKAKYYKTILFSTAMLPWSLYLAGSFHADPPLIGAALLFISICVGHYIDKQKEMPVSEKVWLLVCVCIIASIKYMIYAPLLFLFCLVPKKKFSKRGYILEWVGAAIIIIGLLVFQFFLMLKFPFTENRNGDVNVLRQLMYMFGNIPATITVFIRAIIEQTQVYIADFQGDPTFFNIPFFGIVFIMSAILEKNRPEIEKKGRFSLICVAITVSSYLMILGAMYLGFTPVGGSIVEGVQPRYLFPLAPLVMITLANIKIDVKSDVYEKAAPVAAYIMALNSLAGLLLALF